MPFLLFLFVIFAVMVFYVIGIYNWLRTTEVRIKASIQEIGNQLKRQADLIPNLTSSVKGYIKHEKEVFEKLFEARKAVLGVMEKGSAADLVEASEKLSQALAPIRLVMESTPQLQAQAPVVKLMDELRDTADKVMYSRRTLIDLTADFNAKIVVFPSNLVAQAFGFSPKEGLRSPETGAHTVVSEEETKTPKVELN